jgi:hypothetical protein
MPIAECGISKKQIRTPHSELGCARWARLALRKQDRISGWKTFPADAFSAQRPAFWSASAAFQGKGKREERGKPEFLMDSPLIL